MKATRVKIPQGRDPFINTPLVSLGIGDDGIERFWISTWNALMGTTAACVGTDGSCRLYTFTDPLFGGFYSCTPVDQQTLWLCNWLDSVVHLDLRTGKYDVYETGAERALVFQGMAYDRPTGKLFAAANVMTGSRAGGCPTAFVFDTEKRSSICVKRQISQDAYMRASFPNGDGTWTIVMSVPGLSLLRWDPATDHVEVRRLCAELTAAQQHGLRGLVSSSRGEVYLPGFGWYDPRHDRFDEDTSRRPRQEAAWIGQLGESIFGVRAEHHRQDLYLVEWNTQTGVERQVATLEDATAYNVNLTADGRLICVNVYGDMTLRKLTDGRMELAKRLPVENVQAVDCLQRIDHARLLGTPFITQRFWEVNLETGEGYDCGRAAPGWGEVLKTWRIGGKIYMAEYGGGRLVEYDPASHPHHPENPRTVAEPAHAMRPIAAADHGNVLWYACSAPYGHLGSTVVRYDTATGHSTVAVNPLPAQRIIGLWYEAATHRLLATGSIASDCDSAAPSADRARLAWLDADSLEVLEALDAPEGVWHARVLGPLGEDTYLLSLSGERQEFTKGYGLGAMKTSPLQAPDLTKLLPDTSKWSEVLYGGSPGVFVVHLPDAVELWNVNRGERLRVLHQGACHRIMVDADSLYIVEKLEIAVYDGCLSKLKAE